MAKVAARGHYTSWDRPASEHDSRLPSHLSLRQLAKQTYQQKKSWPQTAQELFYGGRPQSMRRAVKAGPCKRERIIREVSDEEAERLWKEKSRPMSDRDRQRVATAYGVTVEQLRALRAAGLTVLEARKMAAGLRTHSPEGDYDGKDYCAGTNSDGPANCRTRVLRG